jgi:hypothetical protein
MVDAYEKTQEREEIELKNNESIEKTIFNSREQTIENFGEKYKEVIDNIIEAEKILQNIENGTITAKTINAENSAKEKLAQIVKDSSPKSNKKKVVSNFKKKSKKKANGDIGLSESGLINYNENGSELIIPASGNLDYMQYGTGIVPATLASNLMEIGKYDLSGLTTHVSNASNISSNKDNSTHIVIQSLSVQSDDANDFVKQLKNLSMVK